MSIFDKKWDSTVCCQQEKKKKILNMSTQQNTEAMEGDMSC